MVDALVLKIFYISCIVIKEGYVVFIIIFVLFSIPNYAAVILLVAF